VTGGHFPASRPNYEQASAQIDTCTEEMQYQARSTKPRKFLGNSIDLKTDDGYLTGQALILQLPCSSRRR